MSKLKLSLPRCAAIISVTTALALTMVVTSPAQAETASVTVDLGTTTLIGTPYLFGGSKFPQQAQAADVLPKMVDAGVNRIRTDMYLELVVPSTTVADYKANVNGVADVSRWNYDHLWGMAAAENAGIKTMFIVDYTPTWLSYSGRRTGVPKDWDVWEDMVSKLYTKYQSNVGWVEVWNEPDTTTLDITGSPYETEEEALADIYYHTVKAIRASGTAGQSVPIGGFAFTENVPQSLDTILTILNSRYGRTWTTENFDYYSFHAYGAAPGEFDVAALRTIFARNGLSPSTDIFVDEYNITYNWQGGESELFTDTAVGYVGKALVQFANRGVGADYFSFYPYNTVLSNTLYEDGIQTSLGFYYVTGDGSTGTLLSQANPMRILSRQLGLGAGPYAVKAVATSVVDATAAVNAAGHTVVFMANYRPTATSVALVVNGLAADNVQVVQYTGTGTDTGSSPTSSTAATVTNGTLTSTITMPANSVVGLDLGVVGSGSTASGQIRSALASSLCLDDQAGNTTDGTKISLWECNTTAAQKWTRASGDTLQVVGKCLTVRASGSGNGTPVELGTCTTSTSQQWTVASNTSLVNTGSGRCLDVPNSTTTPGVQLQIYDCNGTNAQKWTFS